MGWFGKKDRVIDLSAQYHKQKSREERAHEVFENSGSPVSTSAAAEGLGFFGSIANTVSSSSSSESESSEYADLSAPAEEKRRKLAKRLMDITTKLEDLSNQIYHLQQRVELLERKAGVH